MTVSWRGINLDVAGSIKSRNELVEFFFSFKVLFVKKLKEVKNKLPKKIGKDIIDKKGTSIISTPKEHEEFEEWKSEQEEEKEQKPKEQVELRSEMPEEKEPSTEEMTAEMAKEAEKLEKAKAEGKLKTVHVNEHFRGQPKGHKEEDKEEEEDLRK